jgi:hypothetical protein
MNFFRRIFYFVALSVSFLVFASTASAVSSSSTLNVTIGSLTQITVSPSVLNFTGLSPGTQSATQSLDIKNSGSVNVTNIYASVTTIQDEPRRPYGTGISVNYSSGGVIVLKNSSDTVYRFAGRLEWNESSVPSNNNPTGFTSLVSRGFLRNTSYEYFWAIGNGTGYGGATVYCNNTGAQFGISTLADNGTSATRSPAASAMATSDANYGYFPQSSGPLSGSCVAASYDCTKIYIYYYDKSAGIGSCTNAQYIQTIGLIPGTIHTLTLAAYIPYGIPTGSLNTTTFTVTAT